MNTLRLARLNGNGTIRSVLLAIAIAGMFLYPLVNL
jgi:hypothetical protein